MYFPFLRGKQFELIALREIAKVISNGNKINPIIEPVKKKTSTYKTTIEILQQENVNFTVIINPYVGDIKENIDYVCSNLLPSLAYKNFQLGILVHNNTDLNHITQKLIELELSELPIVIILASIHEDKFQTLKSFIEQHNIKYILIGSKVRDRRTILRAIRKVCENLVSLSDPYNKQIRNKDYASEDDEFFSEEHLYFLEEGYKGYSDLLTIGQDYSDKGYSPYAVAIHLTYFSEYNVFRIHHFVSDSNEDTSDVAGKFEEALIKLIPFIDAMEINTVASNEFRKLFDEGKYPGLGTVKKLSILNHIELVNNFFAE